MLVPVAQHQASFVVPGLSADTRGVVSGKAALSVLPSLDRVVGALSALTAQVGDEDLYADARLERLRSELGTVEHALAWRVSDPHVMDNVARVVALFGGETLVGDDRHFVRYRDRKSPLGYDLDRLAEGTGERILYGRVVEGSYRVDERLPLRALALRLAPTPIRGMGPQRETCLVTCEPGLRPHLDGLLWRRNLPASLARVEFEDGRSGYLYRLPSLGEREAALLARTPGLGVFVPEGEQVAVERGYLHPFDLTACSGIFDDGGLYLLEGNKTGARIIRGAPEFVPLRQAIDPEVADVSLPARAAAPGPPTPVALKLAPVGAGSPRADAVLVPPGQLAALRRLVYLLPPAVLEGYRAASLDAGVLVVSDGAEAGVRRIPLGQPLTRFGEQTFLPVGFGFIPRLSPELVADALGAEAGRLYVFPHADIPPFSVPSVLPPLSRAFVADLEVPSAETEAGPPPQTAPRLGYARVGPFPLWGGRFKEPT